MEEAQAAATRELMHKRGLPRLFWVEEEYRDRLRAAEIDYVRSWSATSNQGPWKAPAGGARSTNAASTRCPRPSTLSLFPTPTSKGNDMTTSTATVLPRREPAGRR